MSLVGVVDRNNPHFSSGTSVGLARTRCVMSCVLHGKSQSFGAALKVTEKRALVVDPSEQTGGHADEVHSSLHPLYQTQRDEEIPRLGGEPSEAPSRVPGTQRKHPRSQSWLCVPTAIRQVPS